MKPYDTQLIHVDKCIVERQEDLVIISAVKIKRERLKAVNECQVYMQGQIETPFKIYLTQTHSLHNAVI